MRPFYGVEPVLLDPQGKELHGNDQRGALGLKQIPPGEFWHIFADSFSKMLTLFKKTLHQMGDWLLCILVSRPGVSSPAFYWVRFIQLKLQGGCNVTFGSCNDSRSPLNFQPFVSVSERALQASDFIYLLTIEYNISDRINNQVVCSHQGYIYKWKISHSLIFASRGSIVLKSTESEACGPQYLWTIFFQYKTLIHIKPLDFKPLKILQSGKSAIVDIRLRRIRKTHTVHIVWCK